MIDGAVDQRADIVRRDIGVAGDAVGAAVIGDDRVEHARVRIGVEQEQKLLHGVRLRLLDDVLRLARHERLDIVDELIGEDLHRLLARPGDVRRHDQIGNRGVEQDVAVSSAAPW